MWLVYRLLIKGRGITSSKEGSTKTLGISILVQRALHLDFHRMFCSVALVGQIKKLTQQEKILAVPGEGILMAMILMIKNRSKMGQAIVNVWVIRMKVLYVFLALLLSGCSDLCSVDVLSESNSPDGKYIATVFERNCGATTPFVRVVSLRHADSEFSSEEDDDWVFTIHGQSDIRTSWTENTELKILYSATGDNPTRRTKWGKITIDY